MLGAAPVLDVLKELPLVPLDPGYALGLGEERYWEWNHTLGIAIHRSIVPLLVSLAVVRTVSNPALLSWAGIGWAVSAALVLVVAAWNVAYVLHLSVFASVVVWVVCVVRARSSTPEMMVAACLGTTVLSTVLFGGLAVLRLSGNPAGGF